MIEGLGTIRGVTQTRGSREGHSMKTGTVKWFNLQKGFGYIHPDDGSPNIFVPMSAVQHAGMSDLKEGQRVVFEIQWDRTGKAFAVSLAPEFRLSVTPPPLDGRFTTTNSFDIISASISSALRTRLRP
jgi:CspA family cold shock protein